MAKHLIIEYRAARAAEERVELVRRLRPDHQIPRFSTKKEPPAA